MTPVEHAAALLTACGLGGIAVKLIDVLANRASEQRREPADLTRAAAEFQEALTDGGKELIDEFRREFKFLRGRVVDLQSDADAAKEEARAARDLAMSASAEHEHCQGELADLRKQIEQLMADRLAPGYDSLSRPVG